VEKEERVTDMFLANDTMMYDDVPFVVLLKNPKHSRETFQDTEETLRPVIIKKVAGTLSNCNFEHGFGLCRFNGRELA